MLLDKNGNFIVMLTDGTIYKANTTSPGIFDGSISPFNVSTGLPATLRGDLASCGASVLLPIKLDYFNAYTQNNTAILKWQTSAENNSDKFVIEKSADGINWQALQSVAAAGNSSTLIQYGYVDKSLTTTIVYYRLKMVDKDGTSQYSAIKKLSFAAGASPVLSYYPNPASNIVYAERSTVFSTNLKVAMSSVSGKIISVPFKKADSNRLSIDISALPAGIYFLQINDGIGQSSIQKIIKQ